MKKDEEWKIGTQWMLKATFSSDSSIDRTIGFAGPDGGFLTITIPAGVQGVAKQARYLSSSPISCTCVNMLQ
eukprot:g25461.t1